MFPLTEWVSLDGMGVSGTSSWQQRLGSLQTPLRLTLMRDPDASGVSLGSHCHAKGCTAGKSWVELTRRSLSFQSPEGSGHLWFRCTWHLPETWRASQTPANAHCAPFPYPPLSLTSGRGEAIPSALNEKLLADKVGV